MTEVSSYSRLSNREDRLPGGMEINLRLFFLNSLLKHATDPPVATTN